MIEQDVSTGSPRLVFEAKLDAPPEKVWRALTLPEYLQHWLLPLQQDGQHRLVLDGRNSAIGAKIDCEVVESSCPNLLRYGWREEGSGSRSEVSFELSPLGEDATWLKLTHVVEAKPAISLPAPANSNTLMLLAA